MVWHVGCMYNGMKILVWSAKHDPVYYDASTLRRQNYAMLDMVKSMADGFYLDHGFQIFGRTIGDLLAVIHDAASTPKEKFAAAWDIADAVRDHEYCEWDVIPVKVITQISTD